MPSASLAPARGFVRPRYDDGSFDEPLPLEHHFVDVFLGPRGDRPNQLLLTGPRGSGLTTTLDWLIELCSNETEGERRRLPVVLDDLYFEPVKALGLLKSGEGVLFLDMSVTPRGSGKRQTVAYMLDGLPGFSSSREVLHACDLVVVANETPGDQVATDFGQDCGWGSLLPHLRRATLAPWT